MNARFFCCLLLLVACGGSEDAAGPVAEQVEDGGPDDAGDADAMEMPDEDAGHAGPVESVRRCQAIVIAGGQQTRFSYVVTRYLDGYVTADCEVRTSAASLTGSVTYLEADGGANQGACVIEGDTRDAATAGSWNFEPAGDGITAVYDDGSAPERGDTVMLVMCADSPS